MKYLILFMLLISTNVFACWKMEGSLGVDGETFKINQKVDHDKEYAFPMGAFILRLTVKKGKKNTHTLLYKLEEKKGLKLDLVTKGDDEIEVGKQREIYAKGEEGQPGSILTIKITNI